MYLRLFEFAKEELWIWAVFVLGAVGCYLALAQRSAVSLGFEILRSVESVFVGPFHYLRKTITELSLGDANPRLHNVAHYLLRRLLTAVQVGLLLSIFIGAGLALASAVEALLPPLSQRQDLASQRDQLAKTEASLMQDTSTVAAQDSYWNDRHDELIRQAQQREAQKKADLQAALSADEAAVKSQEGTQALKTLRNYLATRGTEAGAVGDAKSFVSRMPLNESETAAMVSYCDHWQELKSLSNRGPITPDEVRAEVQKDHATLVQRVTDEKAQIPNLQSKVNQLQNEVNDNYHPGAFVWILISSFLVFISYVWAAGTCIEIFSIALYLSNDVKQIRTRCEQTTTYN